MSGSSSTDKVMKKLLGPNEYNADDHIVAVAKEIENLPAAEFLVLASAIAAVTKKFHKLK